MPSPFLVWESCDRNRKCPFSGLSAPPALHTLYLTLNWISFNSCALWHCDHGDCRTLWRLGQWGACKNSSMIKLLAAAQCQLKRELLWAQVPLWVNKPWRHPWYWRRLIGVDGVKETVFSRHSMAGEHVNLKRSTTYQRPQKLKPDKVSTWRRGGGHEGSTLGCSGRRNVS